MAQLTAEQARTIRDYLLPSIETEHKITRMTIQSMRPDLLNSTVPAGQSISNLVWQMVGTEHLYLTGICEARIPAMRTKAGEHSVQAILVWYDEHIKGDYERLSQLSGEELLRPVEIFGQTKPVVEYLPVYMSVTIQNRGLLAGYLAILTAQQASMPSGNTEEATGGAEDGELREQELAAIVGGDSSGTVIVSGAALNNFASVTITSSTPNWQFLQALQNQQTIGGLGALFGGGISGAVAGGLSGAVLGEYVAAEAGTAAAASAAQKAATAAVAVFDLT